MSEPNANLDQQGFTGHIRDSDTGLTYMQARYYDPVIGRFLSNDPVGFAQGGVDYFNRYSYTANDPVNATDPDGEFINFLIGGAIGAVVEGITIAAEGGDPFDVQANAGRYGKAAAIGAISGGVGGLVAKQGASIAGKTILSQAGKAGGGTVGAVAEGALAGGVAGATGESLTQLAETGSVSDFGAVGQAAGVGALTGGLAGGAQQGAQNAGKALSGRQPLSRDSLQTKGGRFGMTEPLQTGREGVSAGSAASVAVNTAAGACGADETNC